MKKKSKISIFFSVLFYRLSMHPEKKSFPMFKRMLVDHECRYTGEFKIMHGYSFIKCIHWGCFTYSPVNYDCKDYGHLTEKDFLQKRINYFQNKIDTYEYTCGWSEFDNALVEYMKREVKMTRNDLLKSESNVYYNLLMEYYKLPFDKQPHESMEIWREKFKELNSKMSFT